VLQAQVNINQAQDSAADNLTIESTAADKAYHAVAEMKPNLSSNVRRSRLFQTTPSWMRAATGTAR